MGDQTDSRMSKSVAKLDLSEDKPDIVRTFSKLSPDSQSSIQVLMQKIAGGEVYLNFDEKGQQILEYQENRKQSYVDASQANVIVKPRTEADVHKKVDACLELIDFFKREKPPGGVVLDGSKIHLNHGKYREGFEFNCTKQVLGNGNSAGDIVVVTDNKTKHQHALKTIMIAVFRKQEIECWIDLTDTGYVPSLFLFNVRDNKVEVHMEILTNSLTMRSIVDDHMQKLDRSLLKPFSLYVLNGTLEAVSAMHGKNWVHKDLHGGNVMLQSSQEKVLDLKIIDFGMASELETRFAGLDFRGFRSDIASVLRMFCALYVTNEFNNVQDIQTNWKEGLEQVTSAMGSEDKSELFCLVDLAMGIVHPEDVSKYSERVRRHLNKALSDIGQTEMDVLKQVAAMLFPEQRQETKGLDTADCTHSSSFLLDEEDGFPVHQQCSIAQSSPGTDVIEQFIFKLRLSMSVGPAA